MSHHHHHEEDDFAGDDSTYKVGQKKSVNEYQQLDAEDESLNRWKAQLGLSNATAGDTPDNVVVERLALEVAGRPDVELDLTQSAEELRKQSFTIKEGVEYRLKVYFRVQHSLVSGLRYKHVVKRKTMGTWLKGKFDKADEMIGSYAAKPDIIEKKASIMSSNSILPPEAPSGMMARGDYLVKSRFEDDDKFVHKEWEWSFTISKDW
ncbi:RHO protein GDP dissociation inhibitor [Mortierella sp. GBAus27b]|nr:RHO protein GDP dissociation inhibitor [Mortierella sp. GBAus27b]